jgi:hypothetical protein
MDLHVTTYLWEGKTIGSKRGKRLGCGLFMCRMKKLSKVLTVYDLNFNINIRRVASE